RDSISRIDLGSPLLEQMSYISRAMARRNGAFSPSPSPMPSLQGPDPSRRGVVWRRNRSRSDAALHRSSRLSSLFQDWNLIARLPRGFTDPRSKTPGRLHGGDQY